MTDVRPFWLAGRPDTGTDQLDVTNPYTAAIVAQVAMPTATQIEQAVAAAVAAATETAVLPAHARADALAHVSRRISERADEIAKLITAENGKPLKWARIEAARAASTFRWAAEEARRFGPTTMRLDTDPAVTGRLALINRIPYGPVLGISPFNFPLNLVAHKVAPAVAVGAPIIVKPASATPLSALLLGELVAETDLPGGIISVLPTTNERASALVADPRLPVISFTGSGPVGWWIRDSQPRKHMTLELGGNGAVVVCGDYKSDSDLDWAASRIATFANYQAGQSCIAVQRVYVDRALCDDLTRRLVAYVEALRPGDPADEATDVGPMVDESAAERVEAWVAEAVASGARLLTGGARDGTTVAPTVLADAPADAKVVCEEVFGPVLTITAVDGVDEAFKAVNDSKYGLQAGVFTHDVQTAFRAGRELEVGGVIIGDVPSYRADQMPYGGAKESGVGREGVHSAMDDLTYERVVVLTGLQL